MCGGRGGARAVRLGGVLVPSRVSGAQYHAVQRGQIRSCRELQQRGLRGALHRATGVPMRRWINNSYGCSVRRGHVLRRGREHRRGLLTGRLLVSCAIPDRYNERVRRGIIRDFSRRADVHVRNVRGQLQRDAGQQLPRCVDGRVWKPMPSRLFLHWWERRRSAVHVQRWILLPTGRLGGGGRPGTHA